MSKFAAKLYKKIKYHRYMMRKYERVPDKYEYHKSWLASTEKELKEYTEARNARVLRS